MNMDMLSRGFDILQRAGGMEQISQLMVIVYGVLCVFGLLNCILGYRILRFWMMIFGFIIGAGAGFGVTYMSGVQDKMVIAGAMAGLGIVLAVVSFLIYRAGIFVLGFGIGITLSIYLVHPTSSFSFFLCILIGVGLGVLAMRYAKGVIIVGTSILGGVLAGLSIAKIAGLAQFPYGVGMAAGIAILGMLIQFAINKDRYDEEDDEEEDDDDGTLPEETRKPAGRDRRGNSREYTSDRNRDDHRYTYENRANDDRESRGERRSRRPSDREGRNSDRRERNYADSRKRSGSERAKAVPLKEEALPEPPAETEPPTEIMLRMTEEAADTARAAAPGNEGMQEREADPAMQIRRIMKTMIVLMSRKTGTAMKILKNCSRKDAGWILKIWRILMSRKNMEITGMTRI